MTSTETITHELSNQIFDIKERIKDGEYKSILENLFKLNIKKEDKFFKITYLCSSFSPESQTSFDCKILKRTKYLPKRGLPEGLIDELTELMNIDPTENELFCKNNSACLEHHLQDDRTFQIAVDCDNDCDCFDSRRCINKQVVILAVSTE
jgi:hypothetical protein